MPPIISPMLPIWFANCRAELGFSCGCASRSPSSSNCLSMDRATSAALKDRNTHDKPADLTLPELARLVEVVVVEQEHAVALRRAA
jgi:hypothetical protein